MEKIRFQISGGEGRMVVGIMGVRKGEGGILGQGAPRRAFFLKSCQLQSIKLLSALKMTVLMPR